MTYNRKPCAALFLESEYEALILEAYSESRVTTERLRNGRYPFSCTFCKEVHKDKNMTSYHRMFNLCKVYKGPAALKMYPTWEKSDHGELNRIARKYGKVFQCNTISKPSANLKREPDDVLHLSTSKRRKIQSTAAPKPLQDAPCKVSRSTVSQEDSVVEIQDSPERDVSNDSDDHMDDADEGHSAGTSAKNDSECDTPPVAPLHSQETRSASVSDDFRIVTYKRTPRALTRKDVEERAWVKAKLKFPEENFKCIPPPPPPVEVSGLFILISEVDIDWMPKDLLNDPQGCMDFLHKMVEEGTLGVKLGSAFGQWFLYGKKVSAFNFLQCIPRPSVHSSSFSAYLVLQCFPRPSGFSSSFRVFLVLQCFPRPLVFLVLQCFPRPSVISSSFIAAHVLQIFPRPSLHTFFMFKVSFNSSP
jgi:hypothetical protein